MLTPFLLYQLKLAALFMLLYVFFRIFLAKESFHAFNRVVILLSVLIALLLPFCRIAVHVPATHFLDSVSTAAAAAPATESALPWPALLLSFYIAGAVSVLAGVIASIFSILRILSGAEQIRQPDGTVLAIVDRKVSPMSWMKFIILSREDYEEGAESVIIHEKAHVMRKHSLDVLFADLFTALQWFNPAAWMMREDLRSIHEYEADSYVIKSGIDAKQYQLLLVKKAFGPNGRSVSNNFNHGKLKKRITMMLKTKSPAYKALKFLYVIPLVFAGLAVNARTVYDVPDTLSIYTENGSLKIEKDMENDRENDREKDMENDRENDREGNILPKGVKIYVDGQPATPDQIKSMAPEKISSVSIIKNDTENVMYVYTDGYSGPRQSGEDTQGKTVVFSASGSPGNAALQGKVNTIVINDTGNISDMDVYVDGKKVEAKSFTKIDSNDIESVTVNKNGERPSVQIFMKKK